MTLNRYLPIWTYDVYEYYFNDCRWSPETHGKLSPEVRVKGYWRDETGVLADEVGEGVEVTVDADCEIDENGVEQCEEEVIISYVKVYWTDLGTLQMQRAVALAATTGISLIFFLL